MKEFEGTKGKWYYQEESDAYTHIVRSNKGKGLETVFITQLSQDTTGESEANGRLIAAAPELLKSLIILVKRFDTGSNSASDDAYIQDAKKVINRALGKEK